MHRDKRVGEDGIEISKPPRSTISPTCKMFSTMYFLSCKIHPEISTCTSPPYGHFSFHYPNKPVLFDLSIPLKSCLYSNPLLLMLILKSKALQCKSHSESTTVTCSRTECFLSKANSVSDVPSGCRDPLSQCLSYSSITHAAPLEAQLHSSSALQHTVLRRSLYAAYDSIARPVENGLIVFWIHFYASNNIIRVSQN